MFRFQPHAALCQTLMAYRSVRHFCCSKFQCHNTWSKVHFWEREPFCLRTRLKHGCHVGLLSQCMPNVHITRLTFSRINIGEVFSNKEDDSISDDRDKGTVANIAGSSALYQFKETLDSDSRLTLNDRDWQTLESDILNENPDLHKSWTATCMMLIYSAGNVELGEGLLHYIRHIQGNLPNVPTLSTFIALCGRYSGKLKQDLLLTEYNELLKRAQLFDSITTKNLIVGFCGTDYWKKSLEFLKMTELTLFPGPSYFNPIVVAAVREGDMEIVFSLLDEMGSKNKVPSNMVFEKFIQMCSISGSEENINIKSLFGYFREFNWLPDRELAYQIESLFVDSKTEHWKSNWTTVDKSGVCHSCKHQLGKIILTNADFKHLQQEFLTSALIGENVYLKSNPEEMKRFKKYIQEYAPFDVVLDALNVAGLGNSNMLRKVVEFFARYRKKKVLLVGRKHMERSLGRNYQPIRKMASTFFTDNISKDDPFTLYAAIYSGKSTMLVSNDYMRDHKCLLSPSLQDVFEQWQRSRQISMRKVHNDKFSIKMPLKYDTGPQEDLNGWHVPYEDWSERAVYEHPNTYLCLRSTKLPEKT